MLRIGNIAYRIGRLPITIQIEDMAMKHKGNRHDSVNQPDLSVFGPIREIMRLVQEGKRTKNQLQRFVEGRNPFYDPIDPDRAAAILGKEKIVFRDQAYKALRIPEPFLSPSVLPYSSETIYECGEQNRKGLADWHLIYILPMSLNSLYEKIGTNTLSEICFADSRLFLQLAEHRWAHETPEARYYLIDFEHRYGLMTWNEQEAFIKQRGTVFERADLNVLTQALVTVYVMHSVALLHGVSHWGKEILDSGGRAMVTMSCNRSGYVIKMNYDYTSWPSNSRNLHAYVCKQPEITLG